MYFPNYRGGSFEITIDNDHGPRISDDMPSPQLDEIQQSWRLLGSKDRDAQKKNYVLLCCSSSRCILVFIICAFLLIGIPVIISTGIKNQKKQHNPPDHYREALKTALLFFNAQKSGRLPKDNNVTWRGDSGLKDGLSDGKTTLVGGYYDAGDNTKFHFPMAFSMTMLSWSLIEYSKKYKTLGEYEHAKELIKWGTDYLLLAFDSSAKSIDQILTQVGGSRNNSKIPDDRTCWQRPEDMNYPRPVQTAIEAPDLAAEMAAALASASIVFQDNFIYSSELVNGAKTLYEFAIDKDKGIPNSKGNPYTEPYYNSTGYFDEHLWASAWLFYATGNSYYYLGHATSIELATDAKVFDSGDTDLIVLSWDNKLPAAELLLTGLRMLMNPGYPYEDLLARYHDRTHHNMCSYLPRFNAFRWTPGDLIQLNPGCRQPLQYVANAAFLASLFVDYMNAAYIPGFYCGENFISSKELLSFATSGRPVNYILGDNPMDMNYLVGYGHKYPKQVHHRGASIGLTETNRGCYGGRARLNKKERNPNEIKGAMVGGPYKSDEYRDNRHDYESNEPTLAGNAGLVAALASLSTSTSNGIDKNTIFTHVPRLYSSSSLPPTLPKP